MNSKALTRYMTRKAQEVAQDLRAFELGYISSEEVRGSAGVQSVRNRMNSSAVPYQEILGFIAPSDPVVVYRIDGSPSQKYIMGYSPYAVPKEESITTDNYDIVP